MRRIAMWAVRYVPLGRAAPYVLAFALNSRLQRLPVEDSGE